METKCPQEDKPCPIDPVKLGIQLAEIDRDVKEMRLWQKKNWRFTKAIHKKVKVMSITLRWHRVVFAGIWGFVSISSLLIWELSKDWIKVKIKLLIGG